ncbi:hypothetical protein B0T19DRAFT_283770 [Cercophora scortea]|uniref:Uncharacterized protein n=1 Tax=Cercophora scortea TaxID=314031 RepID=A0AAE0I8F0_9PEZI|nr:hypothetical protein B0T19DRAFT_283770 [Cercophora scortea]
MPVDEYCSVRRAGTGGEVGFMSRLRGRLLPTYLAIPVNHTAVPSGKSRRWWLQPIQHNLLIIKRITSTPRGARTHKPARMRRRKTKGTTPAYARPRLLSQSLTPDGMSGSFSAFTLAGPASRRLLSQLTCFCHHYPTPACTRRSGANQHAHNLWVFVIQRQAPNHFLGVCAVIARTHTSSGAAHLGCSLCPFLLPFPSITIHFLFFPPAVDSVPRRLTGSRPTVHCFLSPFPPILSVPTTAKRRSAAGCLLVLLD